MGLIIRLIVAAGVLLFGAAGIAGDAENPLADTEWRLVEFQSMDDAEGTVRPGTRRSTPCA
jgi:hypothetical protein